MREEDMHQLREALTTTLERHGMSIHMDWNGQKTALDSNHYPFFYDLHKAFRKEENADEK